MLDTSASHEITINAFDNFITNYTQQNQSTAVKDRYRLLKSSSSTDSTASSSSNSDNITNSSPTRVPISSKSHATNQTPKQNNVEITSDQKDSHPHTDSTKPLMKPNQGQRFIRQEIIRIYHRRRMERDARERAI